MIGTHHGVPRRPFIQNSLLLFKHSYVVHLLALRVGSGRRERLGFSIPRQ